ncbi:hypothetical protein PIB30_068323 [Stylosanthes scabra]|uniref:Putative plant transposon protein domain-containing protein n=1 Tax=Stylosanthes scabra TaxID=79078 RepID=A0ABU6UPI9_9FABA|nr:hypothetical protein [Stylosanthes scabra]
MVDEHCFRALFNQNLFEEIIALKGWRSLAIPRTKISKLLIQEFYANVVQTEEELEQAEQHPYKSYVRGVEVNFSPENIRRVLRFIEQTLDAETDYAIRQRMDQRLDEVLRDLCIPGATWRLSSGKPAQPIQLRRVEHTPLARGWQEFIIHSIIPTGNKSEITIARAILIHSIMRGEDVRAEELIAENIAVIAQGMQGKGKLGFPSTIYKMCKDAQQQGFHLINKQLADFSNNNSLKTCKVKKARQDELWNNTNKFHHQIRKEQDMIAREIQEVKKFQVNQTLMGFRKEAVEKLEQIMGGQQKEMTEIKKQLKEWTRHASSRDAYCCWAHQQPNPNLTEIPIHQIPDVIQANVEKGRHIFHGVLKSQLVAGSSSQAPPPQPSYEPMADPKN